MSTQHFNLPSGASLAPHHPVEGDLIPWDPVEFPAYAVRQRPEDQIIRHRSAGGIDIMLTPKARDLMRSTGYQAVRSLVEAAIEDSLANPFGNTIDHFADTDAGMTERTVNHLSPEAEQLLGTPIALKGTGLAPNKYRLGHRTTLDNQFIDMYRIARAQQRLHPDGIGGILTVNEPLAYIGYNHPRATAPSSHTRPARQEWLLMPRVVDAQPVTQYDMVMSRGGLRPGFNRAEHPELAAFADGRYPSAYLSERIPFAQVKDELSNALHPDIQSYDLGDVTGNNTLHQDTPAGRKYTLIDIQNNDRPFGRM